MGIFILLSPDNHTIYVHYGENAFQKWFQTEQYEQVFSSLANAKNLSDLQLTLSGIQVSDGQWDGFQNALADLVLDEDGYLVANIGGSSTLISNSKNTPLATYAAINFEEVTNRLKALEEKVDELSARQETGLSTYLEKQDSLERKQDTLIENFVTWSQNIANELNSMVNATQSVSSTLSDVSTRLEALNTSVEHSYSVIVSAADKCSQQSASLKQSITSLETLQAEVTNYVAELKRAKPEDLSRLYVFESDLQSAYIATSKQLTELRDNLSSMATEIIQLTTLVNQSNGSTDVVALREVSLTLERLGTTLETLVSRDSDTYSKFVKVYNDTFENLTRFVSQINDSLDAVNKGKEDELKLKRTNSIFKNANLTIDSLKSVKDITYVPPEPEAPVVL